MTAISAAMNPEPVDLAEVGKSAAPDETMSAEAGLAASSRYRAKCNNK